MDNSKSEASSSDAMSLSGTGASERINPGECVAWRDVVVEKGVVSSPGRSGFLTRDFGCLVAGKERSWYGSSIPAAL